MKRPIAPSDALIEAAFELSVHAPQLWQKFARAYSDYTISTALSLADADPSRLPFAQGGLHFCKQQAEAFGDIQRVRLSLEERRQKETELARAKAAKAAANAQRQQQRL